MSGREQALEAALRDMVALSEEHGEKSPRGAAVVFMVRLAEARERAKAALALPKDEGRDAGLLKKLFEAADLLMECAAECRTDRGAYVQRAASRFGDEVRSLARSAS
jgi:hypothetical protein